MGILAALSSEGTMQEGPLTANGASHKLHLTGQLGCQDAAPVHKCLHKAFLGTKLYHDQMWLQPEAGLRDGRQSKAGRELQVCMRMCLQELYMVSKFSACSTAAP